jgi:hypothetical protein
MAGANSAVLTAFHIGRRGWVLLATGLLWLPLQAQRGPRSEVSGHVVCADTNAPARLAKVTLNPLVNFSATSVYERTAVPGVLTDMNGEFHIPDVPPGRYLVLAELSGYVSGISGLDEHARQHLRDAAQTPPDGSAIVDVANGLPATVDIVLERGASVSGSIRYDDGSPAIGILVGLERKSRTGTWEAALDSTSQAFSFFSKEHDASVATDSAGRFRIDGMPPGEYIVHAHLAPQIITLPLAGEGTLGVYDHPGVQLDVYSGGAFWRKQAKPITVGRGDEVDIDLEIPLGKLKTVSGTVVSAGDGHGLNSGSVTLIPQDDPGEQRSTEIAADGGFQFLYVPEGDYELRTEKAADGVNAEQYVGVAKFDVTLPAHPYGATSTTVHVGDEPVNVTLRVPERDAQSH